MMEYYKEPNIHTKNIVNSEVNNEIWGLFKMPDIAKREQNLIEKKGMKDVHYLGMYREYPVFTFFDYDNWIGYIGVVDDGLLHGFGIKIYYQNTMALGYKIGEFDHGYLHTGKNLNESNGDLSDYFIDGVNIDNMDNFSVGKIIEIENAVDITEKCLMNIINQPDGLADHIDTVRDFLILIQGENYLI